MITINKEGPRDHTFVAVFKDTRIQVYACSLPEAKQRALEYYKPKKRDTHMLRVEMIKERDDLVHVS